MVKIDCSFSFRLKYGRMTKLHALRVSCLKGRSLCPVKRVETARTLQNVPVRVSRFLLAIRLSLSAALLGVLPGILLLCFDEYSLQFGVGRFCPTQFLGNVSSFCCSWLLACSICLIIWRKHFQ